jgi:hypothetical protein
MRLQPHPAPPGPTRARGEAHHEVRSAGLEAARAEGS